MKLRFIAVLATFICQSQICAGSDKLFLAERTLLADYNNEIRTSDGRLDIPQMIARLSQLKVDTYFYLIWHSMHDWEDLKLFLPEAREAGIDIWVYLVPPSESPPLYGTRYSEPFRLDYVRWGEEIAKLSLEHPNLTAWVIDDFYSNRSVYTPEYVGTMTSRSRLWNPSMKFLPLMYYYQIDREFVSLFKDVIDGVVSAYPADSDAIQQAWRFLNDDFDEPARFLISYPWNTLSSIGTSGSMRCRFRVLPGGPNSISLTQRDDYTGPTVGYHFKELLVDGQVVWEEDVGGGDRTWKMSTVDLDEQVRGKSEVEIVLRVYDRLAVSNFGVDFEFLEFELEGLERLETWQSDKVGQWTFEEKEAYEGNQSFRIPLVVMIAGVRSQFVKRNGEPASVERIRDKIQMAITQMRNGFAEGVVTYALLKDFRDDVFGAVWQLFLRTRRSQSADFDSNGKVNFDDFLLFAQAFGRNVGNDDGPDAAYDLDVDGVVNFADFALFAMSYGR